MKNEPWPENPLDWVFRSGPKRGQKKILVDHGCWIWQGTLDKKGYGEATFHISDFPGMRRCRKLRGERVPEGWRKCRVHQLTYFIANGRNAPKGKELGHTCLRVRCCNPEHVRPVTTLENYQDKFHPPEIPDTLRRTIELRLALDESPRRIADEVGMSIWTLRTMAEQIRWPSLLPTLMEHAAGMSEYDDSVPFRDERVDGVPF